MWLVTVIKFGYDFVNVAVLFGKSVSLALRYVFNMYIVSIICTQNCCQSQMTHYSILVLLTRGVLFK